MTFRSDPLFEMLDTATANRMLDGTVLPGDAPPGYERVALLLSVLSEPRPPMTAAAAAPRTVQLPRISGRRRRPVLVTTVVAAAILSCTAGAAFANILPTAIGRPLHHLMQHIAHPSASAEPHTATITTPPAGMPATESPRRETAAQRPHDRPQAGSTTSAPTLPPSNAGGEPGLHPTSTHLADLSHQPSISRSTARVPSPGRPAAAPSMSRSAARPLLSEQFADPGVHVRDARSDQADVTV
jgi:hypothetical protein